MSNTKLVTLNSGKEIECLIFKNEKEFVDEIINHIKTEYPEAAVIDNQKVNAIYDESGEPDLRIIYNNKNIYLEVKNGSNGYGASKKQQLKLMELRKLGHSAFVIYPVTDYKQKLNNLMDGTKQ